MKENLNFDIKITRKIADIPEKDWLSIFPKVSENYHFFKSLDESEFDQFSFYYIIIYENSIPIAATSCFTMDFQLDMTVQGPLKSIFGAVRRVFPNFLNHRVLMCGLPMGQGRIGFLKETNYPIDQIHNCLEKIAVDEKAAMIIFKDFINDYNDALMPLLEKRFHKIESLPSTEMEVQFSNFDDYLKKLSPASRDGLKRKFKKVDGKVKIDLEVINGLDEVALEEVYSLYLQTFDKTDMGFEKLPKDFFVNISRNIPDGVKYFLWRIDGKLVSFALCLICGEHFIDYYLGFDYTVAYEYNLYFVRFRDLMQWCINNGIKKYEMGTTAYEPKRRLGFDFLRLYYYMKHRNPLINHSFRILSPFLKPENFDPVFKEISSRSVEV